MNSNMIENKPSICIVMSTYNGELYIDKQIESILEQSEVDIKIYIRDDGSSDNTLQIIEKYAAVHDCIYVESGQNLGLNRSFWQATKNAVSKFHTEFYAFADQDDIWKHDKLIAGIKSIKEHKNEACLYYSNLLICDQDLNERGNMYPVGIVKDTYQQALAQIFCWGCTCIFNDKAADLYIQDYYDYSHDCWLYYICMFCGKTIYDDTSYILYRRHGHNFGNSGKPIYGEGISKLRIVFDKIKNIKRMNPTFSMMSASLLSDYRNNIKNEAILYLQTVSSYKNNFIYKLKLVFTNYIQTSGFFKNLSIKFRILISKW